MDHFFLKDAANEHPSMAPGGTNVALDANPFYLVALKLKVVLQPIWTDKVNPVEET